MTFWFTSDTHFGHKNIIEYCRRPFKAVEEMDEIIIKKWNSVVKPEDIVFHLGDFALKNKVEYYRKRLLGNIIWIRGNHDHRNETILHSAIINYYGHNWYIVHDPLDIELDFNLCGHVHELWKYKEIDGKVAVNVGVDQWEFKPINMKSIIRLIRKQGRIV